jgi:hypothetical protein
MSEERGGKNEGASKQASELAASQGEAGLRRLPLVRLGESAKADLALPSRDFQSPLENLSPARARPAVEGAP